MPTEEERRRKIIIDSQVAQAATRGIALVMSDRLTSDQVRRLIEIDEEYLGRVRAVAAEMADAS